MICNFTDKTDNFYYYYYYYFYYSFLTLSRSFRGKEKINSNVKNV